MKKQLAEATEEKKSEILAEIQKCEDNLLYIKFFPSNEKYLALYAKGAELYEDKRKIILDKIKQKTKEKQEKLKQEISEENKLPEPLENQEVENDDFFAENVKKPNENPIKSQKIENKSVFY